MLPKRVWNILKKKLGEHCDLYVQSNTLLLANVFKNSQDMHLEIYELDPPKFLSAPGLAWQAALKETKVKLDNLTNISNKNENNRDTYK